MKQRTQCLPPSGHPFCHSWWLALTLGGLPHRWPQLLVVCPIRSPSGLPLASVSPRWFSMASTVNKRQRTKTENARAILAADDPKDINATYWADISVALVTLQEHHMFQNLRQFGLDDMAKEKVSQDPWPLIEGIGCCWAGWVLLANTTTTATTTAPRECCGGQADALGMPKPSELCVVFRSGQAPDHRPALLPRAQCSGNSTSLTSREVTNEVGQRGSPEVDSVAKLL